MKKSLFLLMTISVLSCNESSRSNKTENSENESNTNNNFDWLSGKWKRLNNEAGKETFENWSKINPTKYYGIGFTLQNGDTVSQEEMEIIETNGEWALLVKTATEEQATKFKIAEFKKTAFIFVNDSIDFPKKIEYKLEGEKIKAKISNDKMQILFDFEKIK